MKFIVALALFLPLCAALDVTARRYVLAEHASKFYTDLANRHENVTLSIDPHGEATQWLRSRCGEQLMVLQLTQRDFLRNLEQAFALTVDADARPG